VLASAGLPRSLDWPAYWRDLVATYRKACDVAARFGLTFLIHPAIGVLCANTDGFLLFRESVDRPNLRFDLDTANQFVARDHLSLSLVRLADHVDDVRLSDNRGTRPEHLPLGAGAIDWDVLFRTLEQIDARARSGSTSAAASPASPTSTGRTWTRRPSSLGGFGERDGGDRAPWSRQRRETVRPPAPRLVGRDYPMIERLRKGEGPRLRAIRLRALADAPDAFGSTLADAERRTPEDWEAQIEALPTFVWYEADTDLGMVRGAPHDADPEAGYLISMWVAPEARGRGIGAALVREVLAWARGRGLRRLLLDVGAHNGAARRLYERLGFTATGASGALPPPREQVREIHMAIEVAGAGRAPNPTLGLARPLHPDLRTARLAAIPFHWRWALPLWRFGSRLARPLVGPDVDVRDHAEPGVAVRVYRPREGATGAALLWLHGGGLIVGTPRMDDGRCGAWVRELGIVVVSVDYRLAPEHPFPAALDDAGAAWRWLQGSAGAWGIDPKRVAIGGASAGGGLAAGLAQRLCDEGGVQPAAQLLVYPMLDDRTAALRELDDGGHLVWSNRSNRAGWSAYLGRSPGGPDLPAYAAAARRADLSGLPPAWIGVGDLDLFLAEARAYAGRLERAGVATELHEVAGAPHGFDALAPGVPLTRAFAAAQRAFLQERLSIARREGGASGAGAVPPAPAA
jgi:acetyl esterase/lipase/GNAT superfamily N-acetyltransferase